MRLEDARQPNKNPVDLEGLYVRASCRQTLLVWQICKANLMCAQCTLGSGGLALVLHVI